MKKILYVHHTSEFVGSARSLYYLLKELDRTKYEPVVSLIYDGPVRKKYEELGIKVHIVPFPPIWEAPSPYWYNIKNKAMNWLAFHANESFRKLISEIKPDIIHLNDTACLSAGITANVCGLPVVTHVRSVHRLEPAFLQMRSRLLVNNVERISSRIIAIGEEYAIQFGSSRKVDVIYNSLDFSEIENAYGTGGRFRKEFCLDEDDLLIGMVGTLTKHKGAWDFIKAAGRIIDKVKENKVKFIIVGRIHEKTILNKIWEKTGFIGIRHQFDKAISLVKKYNLEEQLIITGHRNDIYNVMDALDIIVFPTRLDATGRPIMEAAAMGKPSIATVPTKKTKVLIDGVTGLITPPEDPHSLSEAIIKLIKDPHIREKMGEAGMSMAKNNFDPKANIQKVQKIYDEL